VRTNRRKRKTKATKSPRAERGIQPTHVAEAGNRSDLAWTAAIFFLHTLGVALLFSPVEGVLTSEPVIEQDWGLHFHHLNSLATFWRQESRLWGYNPFFMAGYPSNTIQDLSIKFFELMAIGLSSLALSPIQWFKLGVFFANASVPWMMYLAARNFFVADDSKRVATTAAAFLGTVYWWNSLPREMFFYGMIGFPAASYLSIAGASLFYRLVKDPGKFGSVHFGWLIFAAASLPLHAQSVIIFLPPIVALLLISPRLLTYRLMAWVAGAATLSLAVNVIWLVPALNHRADDVSIAIVEQLPLFVSTNPFTFLLDYLGPQGYWTFRSPFAEKGFRLALLALGMLGIWRLMQSQHRDLGILLASAALGLFIVTYFGAFLDLVKSWQPLRFKVPFDLFLVIAAAYSISKWFHARPTTPVVVPILLGCGLIAFLVNLAATESTGKLRLRTQLNAQSLAVIDWIERETPAGARVLFEESGDETGFVYDGVYLSSLLPHRTGRQLIGGPINLYNDRHHFAEFHSGRMFKRDVASLSDEELRNYFRLYNVGAVVAFHPASIERLQSVPGLVTVEQRTGPVHLMKVNQPLGWFLKGEGNLSAGLNRLELSQLSGNEIILKYHWVQGLTASPATGIEPVQVAGDPIPFIKLSQPPANVTLRVGWVDGQN